MDIRLEQGLKNINKYRRKNFLTKVDVWGVYQQAKAYGVGWTKGGHAWSFNKKQPCYRPTNPSVACVKLPRGSYGFLFAEPLGWDDTHWFGPWTSDFREIHEWLKAWKTDPKPFLQAHPWIVLSRIQVGCLELEERLTGPWKAAENLF